MYGISGIKNQEKLEQLPLFNKKTAEILIGKTGNNLNKKIQRLLNIDKKYLFSLKKGWYVCQPYLDKKGNLGSYREYLANKLRAPSYLSLEYMLSKYNLIPEAINVWTSITIKSTRKYENELGIFSYKNIKKELFKGYKAVTTEGYKIYRASKAKALFDFIYLKNNLSDNLEYELKKGLRINWSVFSKSDIAEFSKYIRLSQTKKMKEILLIIKKINNVN